MQGLQLDRRRRDQQKRLHAEWFAFVIAVEALNSTKENHGPRDSRTTMRSTT